MTREQFEKAKRIVANIEAADNNIAIFNEFLELEEIAIIDKNGDLPNLWLFGEDSKRAIGALIQKWEEVKQENENDLTNL